MTAWTMRRFVRWAFGPQALLDAVELVRKAQACVEEIAVRPGDPALLRTLARGLHDLRDIADANRWAAEADVFARLHRLLLLPADSRALVRPLRTGLRAIEQPLRDRLARASRVALAESVARAEPVERDAPEVERVA